MYLLPNGKKRFEYFLFNIPSNPETDPGIPGLKFLNPEIPGLQFLLFFGIRSGNTEKKTAVFANIAERLQVLLKKH